MTKPLFMWAGGKNKMLKHYKPLMPSPLTSSVKSYCEPFFGGGAVFIHVMNTYAPKYALINDINPDIVRIYESVKSGLADFTGRLNELEATYIPMSKEDRKKYYYEVRHSHAYDYETWSPAYEAATLYFLMKTGFNGIFQINQNTNGRYGTPSGLLNQKDKVYDRDVLQWWHDALQRTEIRCGDWKDAVSDCPKDTFFFFDPPYRESFADYGNGFSDEQLIDFFMEAIEELAVDEEDLLEICEALEEVELLDEASDKYYDSAVKASKDAAKRQRPSRVERMKGAAKAAGAKLKAGVKSTAKRAIGAGARAAGHAKGEFEAQRIKSKRAAMERTPAKKKEKKDDDDGTGGKLDALLKDTRGTSSRSKRAHEV